LPIEQGDLAEGVAGLHDVQEDFLAAGAARTDAHSSGDHAIQRIARVAAHDNDRVGLVGAAGGQRGDLCNGLFR
jgi:hypothetical protein